MQNSRFFFTREIGNVRVLFFVHDHRTLSAITDQFHRIGKDLEARYSSPRRRASLTSFVKPAKQGLGVNSTT